MVTTIKITCDGVFIQQNSFLTSNYHQLSNFSRTNATTTTTHRNLNENTNTNTYNNTNNNNNNNSRVNDIFNESNHNNNNTNDIQQSYGNNNSNSNNSNNNQEIISSTSSKSSNSITSTSSSISTSSLSLQLLSKKIPISSTLPLSSSSSKTSFTLPQTIAKRFSFPFPTWSSTNLSKLKKTIKTSTILSSSSTLLATSRHNCKQVEKQPQQQRYCNHHQQQYHQCNHNKIGNLQEQQQTEKHNKQKQRQKLRKFNSISDATISKPVITTLRPSSSTSVNIDADVSDQRGKGEIPKFSKCRRAFVSSENIAVASTIENKPLISIFSTNSIRKSINRSLHLSHDKILNNLRKISLQSNSKSIVSNNINTNNNNDNNSSYNQNFEPIIKKEGIAIKIAILKIKVKIL
ncbi:uncharacterized protein DDB_G0288805-like [Condylostylus longicornis]|uniref:uncharacterized protein DDB_G0288805-like n=1 Tax=Condylostylus longicornis TaxID=2530218 RepID=UPI00244E3E7C|nr:uncharacterized protein DDB_G0288805-like [Condylostylus longicornis]